MAAPTFVGSFRLALVAPAATPTTVREPSAPAVSASAPVPVPATTLPVTVLGVASSVTLAVSALATGASSVIVTATVLFTALP